MFVIIVVLKGAGLEKVGVVLELEKGEGQQQGINSILPIVFFRIFNIS